MSTCHGGRRFASLVDGPTILKSRARLTRAIGPVRGTSYPNAGSTTRSVAKSIETHPSIRRYSIAAFFRNAAFARYKVDPEHWPKTAAFVARVLALDGFAKLKPLEDKCIRTPVAEHGKALAELGARVTGETLLTDTPRRGIMPV